MKYESKYSIGHTVWMVRDERFQRIIKCFACKNTGEIAIGEEKFICPKCQGRAAHAQYAGQKYYVYDSSTVGKIIIEDYPTNYNKDEPNPKFTYMLFATGVGSGTIWNQEDLFDSREAAESFCAIKNGVLPDHETALRDSPIDSWGRVKV